MTIVNCSECGARIISRASTCPRCGAKNTFHNHRNSDALSSRPPAPRSLVQEKQNGGLVLLILFLVTLALVILRPLLLSLFHSVSYQMHWR